MFSVLTALLMKRCIEVMLGHIVVKNEYAGYEFTACEDLEFGEESKRVGKQVGCVEECSTAAIMTAVHLIFRVSYEQVDRNANSGGSKEYRG